MANIGESEGFAFGNWSGSEKFSSLVFYLRVIRNGTDYWKNDGGSGEFLVCRNFFFWPLPTQDFLFRGEILCRNFFF